VQSRLATSLERLMWESNHMQPRGAIFKLARVCCCCLLTVRSRRPLPCWKVRDSCEGRLQPSRYWVTTQQYGLSILPSHRPSRAASD
jgi:hypothetical protein